MKDAIFKGSAKLSRGRVVQGLIEARMKQGKNIERVEGLSRGDFFDKYFESEPVILAGIISDWPAVKKWSPEFFEEQHGDTDIWLDYYDPDSERSSLDHHLDWNIKQVKFREYIQALKSNKDNYSLREDKELFANIPELTEDLNNLQPFLDPECFDEDDYKGLWFARKGHVTALHIDIGEGHLFQIYGEKRFTFFSPEQTPYLYEEDRARIDKDERSKEVDDDELEIWKEYMRWSLVNPLHPDYEKFPELKKAEYRVAEVKAGDVIYVPSGWWHMVESLGITISVTAGLDEELFLRA